MKAKYLMSITIIDPDTQGRVQVDIYKEEAGGVFGVDASYLETEEAVHSVFGNGIIELEED